VDNIKVDLREIRWVGMDWINMAQDRALVNTVLNLRVPLNAGKFFCGCIIGGFSRRAQLHKRVIESLYSARLNEKIQ
jgi:hypothetical protein